MDMVHRPDVERKTDEREREDARLLQRYARAHDRHQIDVIVTELARLRGLLNRIITVLEQQQQRVAR